MASSFLKNFDGYKFSDRTMAILEIQREMMDKGAEVFALFFDSVAGYEMLTRHLAQWKTEKREALRKAGMALEDEIWKDLACFPISPPHGHESQFGEFTRTLEDYETRILPDGRNGRLIGNYLLIALYQYWEDSWRGRIADALGLSTKDGITSDFWGDLRLIRICLIHKRGIADRDLVKKTVALNWFQEGDQITLDRPKVLQVISGFFGFLYGELLDYEKKLTSTPPTA